MAVINEFGMPFNDVGGDRTYSASDWRTYYEGLVISGVLGSIGNELKVTQQTVANKTVKIDTGAVLLKGAIRQIDVASSLTIADNTSGNPRIDRIVARLNTTDRKLEFVVKQGAPVSNPVAPTLTQTATTYELSLAKIAVANGFSSITNSNIVDERTYMTYRDRVLNDKVDAFESSINAGMVLLDADVDAVNLRMDTMDPAKYYGKYSQMSGGVGKVGSVQSGIVTFSTEDNDDFAAVNLATSASRITIPSGITKAKFYWHGVINGDGYDGSQSVTVKLYKNGLEKQVLIKDSPTIGNSGTSNEETWFSTPTLCANGDYFEIYVVLTTNSRSTSINAGSIFGMEVLG